MRNNTNINIDTRSLRDTAAAWQTPNLIRSVASETRSTIWMLVILIGGFVFIRALAESWTKPQPNPYAATPQQISDYRVAVLNACQQQLIAQGKNIYSGNNCRQIATVATYNKFGKAY